MRASSNLIWLAAVIGVGAIGVVVLKAKLAASNGRLASVNNKFRAKPLLTPNEFEFLGRLEVSAPELRFCPQVAMGAILDPDVSRNDSKRYMRLRGMFSQKIVDFVAQDRLTGAIVAIIELDDRTHDTNKDGKRDAMLASAGYRTIRWQSKAKLMPLQSALRLT